MGNENAGRELRTLGIIDVVVEKCILVSSVQHASENRMVTILFDP
jgi:hypothetical protein